ncbi:MAG: DCC1-like thiol-disulfide oxidoreductase family protein [Nitrospira sp.]|nr:DCC1-like thiol-disulfide oxidoreductase family protein [Nitrospira sp.]
MNRELDPRSHEWARHERVIVFDGVCNWCNAWVNFTIDHDPQEKFKLGMLQSDQAKQVLQELQLPAENFETFLLLEQGRVLTKSTAALRIVRQLSGFWPLLYLFIVVPPPLRDAAYDFVARHRYKLMGKAETCRVPTPKERARFV